MTSAASEAAASEAVAFRRGGRLKFGCKSLSAEVDGEISRVRGTRFDLLASKLPEEERSPLVGFPSPPCDSTRSTSRSLYGPCVCS